MPNTTVLTTSISADHTTTTVTDSTVYTSPTRTSVGVFINVYKVNFQGTEDLVATTPNSADPGVVASYTFDLQKDGHYRYKYVSIPDWAVTTYSIYDAVFDPINYIVYRSKSNGNAVANLASLQNTANWEAILDPATLADNNGTTTESNNIESFITNKVIGTLTADKRDSHAIDASLECDTDADRNRDVRLFTLLDLFAEALIVADSLSEFNKGERIARRAEAL